MSWTVESKPVRCRVLCLGNRYVAEDAFGPQVHDVLQDWGMPDGVELVDGGIAGLNLLPCFDHVKQVIVVDALKGFGKAGKLLELSPEQAIFEEDQPLGHGTGLPTLLRLMELSCESDIPSVTIVGVEVPADEQSVKETARRVLFMLGSDVGMTIPPEGK